MWVVLVFQECFHLLHRLGCSSSGTRAAILRPCGSHVRTKTHTSTAGLAGGRPLRRRHLAAARRRRGARSQTVLVSQGWVQAQPRRQEWQRLTSSWLARYTVTPAVRQACAWASGRRQSTTAMSSSSIVASRSSARFGLRELSVDRFHTARCNTSTDRKRES